jgi:L-rhamnose isomerase
VSDQIQDSYAAAKHLNLHAIYLDVDDKKVERNEIRPEYYSRWVDWARENNRGIDFSGGNCCQLRI